MATKKRRGMAGKAGIAAKQRTRSKTGKHIQGFEHLSKEERAIVLMYRFLGSRHAKDAFFILMSSLALGRFTEEANKWSWDRLRRELGLPKMRRD